MGSNIVHNTQIRGESWECVDRVRLRKLIHESSYQTAESIIPSIFINNIEQTSKRFHHRKEIIGMISFLKMAAYLHPRWYISKSGVVVNSESEYCDYPNVNGIVENAFRIFEKHYFNIICMLYSGSYQTIMPALRRVLEQAAYITNSVTNKADFTGCISDKDMAMTYEELKNFVYYNELKIDHASSVIDPKDRWIKYTKNFFRIEKYINYLEFDGRENMEALKYIFSKLSKWTHANTWNEIIDDDYNIHDPDKIHFYVSKPNSKEFHWALKTIIQVYEATLYMLLVAAYINVGYYDVKLAKYFFEDMSAEIKTTSIKLPSIEKLFINPPFLEHHSMHMGLSAICSMCNVAIKDDYRCPNCGMPHDVECKTCDYPMVFGTKCVHCDFMANHIQISDFDI